MPRLRNVPNLVVKTGGNPESNKENVNVKSASSKEQDSPVMGELRAAFEQLAINERQPLRKRRTLIKQDPADANIALTSDSHKDPEMKPSATSKKLKANEVLGIARKKRSLKPEGKDQSVTAQITQKAPSSLPNEREQKLISTQSTSAQPHPQRKVRSNRAFSAKMATPSDLVLTSNKKPSARKPRVNIGHQNPAIATDPKINSDDSKAIKTEGKSTSARIKNESSKFKVKKDQTVSGKINKSGNNDNFRISETTIAGKSRGNKKSAKPAEIAIPKVESPALALVKREKPSPQSPIASVSAKFENRTPPATSSKIAGAMYDQKSIKQEKPDTVVKSSLLNQDPVEKKLKKDEGCSSRDPKLRQLASKQTEGKIFIDIL